MPINYHRFQGLLYQKFISPGKYNAKKIAIALNIPVFTLYKYCEGVWYFPPDLISNLYNITKDTDFLNFILGDTDMMLAPRKTAEPEKSVLEETLDVAAASGRVVAVVEEALKDGRLNDIDKRRIAKAIDMDEKELEELRKKVNE